MAIYHLGPAEIEEGCTPDHEDLLEELAFALESEVAPEAALEMVAMRATVRIFRPSRSGGEIPDGKALLCLGHGGKKGEGR